MVAVHMGLFIQLGLENLLETHRTRPPNPRSDDVQRQFLRRLFEVSRCLTVR